MSDQNEASKEVGAARGPSAPIHSLQEAIARTKKFYEEEGRAAAPLATAVKHWGYSEKSSGGRQTVATLIHYGLLKDEGAGDSRRVSVSKLGLDILLLEPSSPEYRESLQRAARAPKFFAELLAKYAESGLPSDGTLKHYLVAEKGFNDSSALSLIKNIRANYAFANLAASDNMPSKQREAERQKPAKDELSPQVGDLVQWELQGVIQFSEPRRLRAIKQHDGTDWGFVDGSETGMLMTELTTIQKAAEAPARGRPTLEEEGATVRPANGEKEWLRGPLSKNASYRLIVTGDLGAKELGKLIKLLEAQKAVLSDDEEMAN